jgi:diadenosine tetraphosphate (Ap4A) HIT family hydrolase
MDAGQWAQRVAGKGCPFDAPRPASNDQWDLVAPLGASTLYLPTNQVYRGQCLLILDLRHAARPDQLSAAEWARFCDDLYQAECALSRVVSPDHINVAALGNVVPHLHWHIIPRYRDDPRWGAPIWTTQLQEMPEKKLPPAVRQELIEKLQAELGGPSNRS